jgi:hypothetical protein
MQPICSAAYHTFIIPLSYLYPQKEHILMFISQCSKKNNQKSQLRFLSVLKQITAIRK